MAKKTTAAPEKPKPVSYGSEVHCSKCQGMVNFNGCAEADCPIRTKK